MKRALAFITLFALAACAPAPTWQVVSLRTSEDQPATEASIARVRIDDQRFSGTTGCADVSGSFEGEDTITLENIELGTPGDCSGWARHTHDQLEHLLAEDKTFQVSHPADFEMILVADSGETLRLMR
ncbi:META domain-containing protein [Corynebacterium afermentans subsp. lipophilum]|uniref:META domain-containing protein n=1 Tax=Corynebacterium afermentans TaxID=38286 RepID=UPI00188A3813|nr:META domain-containing protein [Corynebacterium afermentans]MBF4548135.1 META domain-containing protein [Corynebacterium afermentans subsp. lipophilum]WJY59590.1 hypothetical protein CAFEL_09260 [Corynebacterium afermentans subsp. lipophilum]